jgi:hypothetical protein
MQKRSRRLARLLYWFGIGTGGTWLLKWVLPLAAFFAAAFAYLLMTAQQARYRLIDVIKQVKRYPGN